MPQYASGLPPNKPFSNHSFYLVFAGLGLLFIATGLVLTPSFSQLTAGLKVILTHPSLIDFDAFFWAGNFGSPFVQAGLCIFWLLLFYAVTKTKIGGLHLAALLLITGFAFYGKTILNMWFPVIGVCLSTLVTKKKLNEVSAIAAFSTCMGPIFAVLAFGTPQLVEGSPLAFIVGALVCTFAGFLTGYVSGFFPSLHKGYLLYNVGMAAGWITVLVNSFLKVFGFGHEAYPYGTESYTTGQNRFFTIFLLAVFLYFIIAGLLLGGKKTFSKQLVYPSKKGDDHIPLFGFGSVLINMGLAGAFVLLYGLIINVQLNGTSFAAIFTVVGFSAFSSGIRTHLPLLIGVFVGAFASGGVTSMMAGESFIVGGLAKVASRGMYLSALFTCGVAPIVGDFGVAAGLFMGVIHVAHIPNTGPLHGWMSLYNNGFALGLITTFMYPFYSKMGRLKKTQEA